MQKVQRVCAVPYMSDIIGERKSSRDTEHCSMHVPGGSLFLFVCSGKAGKARRQNWDGKRPKVKFLERNPSQSLLPKP